jgi:hypothetical protein
LLDCCHPNPIGYEDNNRNGFAIRAEPAREPAYANAQPAAHYDTTAERVEGTRTVTVVGAEMVKVAAGAAGPMEEPSAA